MVVFGMAVQGILECQKIIESIGGKKLNAIGQEIFF
jgi:hypothetical protein